MSEALGPGDKVVCVDAKPRANKIDITGLLTEGAYYVISEIVQGEADPRKGVHLSELGWMPFGFYADRFRLVNKRGEGVTRKAEVKNFDKFLDTIKKPAPGVRERKKVDA